MLVAVEAFQADLTLAEQMIDLDALGQLPVKRVKRSTHQLQRRLRSLCEDRRDGRKSVAETCEALVTAFVSNTKARLDQKMFRL